MPHPSHVSPSDPGIKLGDVLRAGIADFAKQHRLSMNQWKVVRAIMNCRTPILGGHLYRCSNCGAEHFVPHACRNRHCPSCQGANSHDWLDKQSELLLPIPYFHLVFTLPHEFNPLIRQNQAQLYALLFSAVSATLLEFGRNHLNAQLGITAVLHTWSQTLLDHYHLHCIVTGGGLTPTGKWKGVKPYWLFPVRALSMVFRGKFRDGLLELYRDKKLKTLGEISSLADPTKFQRLVRNACRPKWVVYAKKPFSGPVQVLAYLSRYTHRVGISDRRILALDTDKKTISFQYKDYADGAIKKVKTLGLIEFIRRFLLHILPSRFVKIRHFGLYSNRNRRTRIAEARKALKVSPACESNSPASTSEAREPPPLICPKCQQPKMVLVRVVHSLYSRRRTAEPVILDSS